MTVQLALADGGPAFDLEGPRIEAKVTRNGRSLPIGSVAALAPGDRVWVHPDFPENPGARYVLVVAFLRGSVDPPRKIGSPRRKPGTRKFARKDFT